VTDPNCIFCKIGRGEIASPKVYDDGVVFAIKDIHPRAPTHILLIPHAHVGALADAAPQEADAAARCVRAAAQVARDVGVTAGGFRLVVNQGLDAGQEVPHFHLHLLAGRRLGAMG